MSHHVRNVGWRARIFLSPLYISLSSGSEREAWHQISGIQAERKLVTVLFADISGFTALSERLDAENVREIINGCFDVLVPVVERYGGRIDKFHR